MAPWSWVKDSFTYNILTTYHWQVSNREKLYAMWQRHRNIVPQRRGTCQQLCSRSWVTNLLFHFLYLPPGLHPWEREKSCSNTNRDSSFSPTLNYIYLLKVASKQAPTEKNSQTTGSITKCASTNNHSFFVTDERYCPWDSFIILAEPNLILCWVSLLHLHWSFFTPGWNSSLSEY